MAEPLIQLKNVTKRFGDRVILDEIDISIYEGETTTIIGKSGVGKSVTLKHIIGLIEPDKGEIRYNGKNLRKVRRVERKTIKSSFSYMFQNNALFDSMTVFDNIALPLVEKSSYSTKEIDRRVRLMIDQLELSEVIRQYPSQLSGGMQKRVALARSLIIKPKIILFDEPTTGLDPIRKNAVLGMIAHYKKQFGFTAIIVSHDIPDIFFISDRIAIIYDGKSIFQGSPFDLDKFDHPYTEEFVNSLVSLKDELTGLETKRSFERQYKQEFGLMQSLEEFALILFSINSPTDVDDTDSGKIIEQVIPSLAVIIGRHIGGAGISSRYSRNEILCVLPYTDQKRVGTLIEELSIELQNKESPWQQKLISIPAKFSISVGVAYGKPGIELDSLAEYAKSQQKSLFEIRKA